MTTPYDDLADLFPRTDFSANGDTHKASAFQNYFEKEIQVDGKPVTIRIGYSAQQLHAQLNTITGDWPRRIGAYSSPRRRNMKFYGSTTPTNYSPGCRDSCRCR